MSLQVSSSVLNLPRTLPGESEEIAATEDDEGETVTRGKRTLLERVVDVSGVKLLTEPIFVIPFLANLFAMVGMYIPFFFIVSRAMTLNVDQTSAAFLISIIGQQQ